MTFQNRKLPRLREYDYSTPGSYFITICTNNKKCILGNIITGKYVDDAQMDYSAIGEIAKSCLLDIESHYQNVKIDNWVIMPNHIHLLISITERINPFPTGNDVERINPFPTGNDVERINPFPTGNDVERINPFPTGNGVERINPFPTGKKYDIPNVIGKYKAAVTRTVGNAFMHSEKLWQSSFYDHIIRDEDDYRIRWQYISGNPSRWLEDQFYVK